ncbi:hypothetical protein ACFVTJ_24105 [Agrobacterium sp. NPDC058088]|uniref:hypothetical protein n=1 Tax=Agrobacterium sp. NPDC058088 TaxID=3346335 RepID=UPI0036DCA840
MDDKKPPGILRALGLFSKPSSKFEETWGTLRFARCSRWRWDSTNDHEWYKQTAMAATAELLLVGAFVEFQLDLHHFSIGRDPHMPEQSCLHTVRYVGSGGPLPNKKAGHILVDINTPAKCGQRLANLSEKGSEIRLIVYPAAFHDFDVPAAKPGTVYFGHRLEYSASATAQANKDVDSFLRQELRN